MAELTNDILALVQALSDLPEPVTRRILAVAQVMVEHSDDLGDRETRRIEFTLHLGESGDVQVDVERVRKRWKCGE